MEVDLQKEARRGRAARAELALVKEHIEAEKQKLFGHSATRAVRRRFT